MPSHFRSVASILLIDDDTDDHLVFSEALQEITGDIRLFTASTCEQWLVAAEPVQPDLIFLDINMPECDGFACLQALRRHPGCAEVPVVMYSCSDYSKDIQKAYDLGAALYFRKPSSFQELVISLQSILNMKWLQPAQIRQRYTGGEQYRPFNPNESSPAT
ncbi:MAG TPA: response regulator [Chitinophagaceae bacterium]|jgi:PleD family two-component response regulator|nr:response regulator [Chitinophagaceae bacterium]